MTRRRIDIFVLGGTIAMTRDADGTARPSMRADDLLAGLAGEFDGLELVGQDVSSVPSTYHTEDDLVRLARKIDESAQAGADGVVVVQGTDTLEETSFLLALLHEQPCPVVCTAAMRLPDAPGADGPANLRAAVATAAGLPPTTARVFVTLGGEIHAAQYVAKRHAFSPAAFESPGRGPVGWVAEGQVRLSCDPGVGTRIDGDVLAADPAHVLLYRYTFGDDGRVLDLASSLECRGVVLEACGVGHVSPAVAERAGELAGHLPVVLTTRTGAGEVLTSTYGFEGSESDLRRRGLLLSGGLDSLKVKVLVSLGLRAGWTASQLEAAMRSWTTAATPQDRTNGKHAHVTS